MGKKITLLAILLLSLQISKAQQCLTTHFSAMIIQGEAMGRGRIGDDLGMGLNMVYGVPIGSKAHFNLVISHLQYNIDYMAPSGEKSSYYYGSGSHSSIGAGLMFFPFIKGGRAALYNPFRVYISANGGMAYQFNETIDAINIPSSFTVFEEGKMLPYAEGLVDVKIRMNPKLSVDLFAGGRTTFSDEIDGLAESGAGFDVIGRIGIGICTQLR